MSSRFLATALASIAFHWVAAEKDLGGGWKEKNNNEGKVVQELKIEAPSFTEEDQYGAVMPDRYRCDSCKAIVFHVDQDLRKKQPKSRRMKQWEYTELFDETCSTSFQGYGVKLVNGENTLSGPGVPQLEDLAPGMGAIQMGGEAWNKRLGEICRKMIYEQVGEDELYDSFYRGFRASAAGEVGTTSGLTHSLCTDQCKPRTKLPTPAKTKGTRIIDMEPSAKTEKTKPRKEKAKQPKATKVNEKDVAPARKAQAEKSDSPSSAMAALSDEKVDVGAFFRTLAVRHGLTSDEYLAARSMADWERLLERIHTKLAAREPEETFWA